MFHALICLMLLISSFLTPPPPPICKTTLQTSKKSSLNNIDYKLGLSAPQAGPANTQENHQGFNEIQWGNI